MYNLGPALMDAGETVLSSACHMRLRDRLQRRSEMGDQAAASEFAGKEDGPDPRDRNALECDLDALVLHGNG